MLGETKVTHPGHVEVRMSSITRNISVLVKIFLGKDLKDYFVKNTFLDIKKLQLIKINTKKAILKLNQKM
tara:strand:- start:752 stop:961 length:210 start_codon:yes stop_codon:yes gene_type:complete